MTDKEYEQKKRECLLDFCREYDYKITPSVERTFGCAFDRAYALGKQESNFFQNGNTHYSGNHFADVRKMVDTRLHIAAMVMAGALANKNVTMGCGAFEDNMEYITKTALMYADALISEYKKGVGL